MLGVSWMFLSLFDFPRWEALPYMYDVWPSSTKQGTIETRPSTHWLKSILLLLVQITQRYTIVINWIKQHIGRSYRSDLVTLLCVWRYMWHSKRAHLPTTYIAIIILKIVKQPAPGPRVSVLDIASFSNHVAWTELWMWYQVVAANLSKAVAQQQTLAICIKGFPKAVLHKPWRR